MKWKYYLLTILVILAAFTVAIPLIHHSITHESWFEMHKRLIMKKYNPKLCNNNHLSKD